MPRLRSEIGGVGPLEREGTVVGRHRRAVAALLGAAALVGAGVLGAGAWSGRTEANAYPTAHRCHHGASGRCWSETPATVVQTFTGSNPGGKETYRVDVRPEGPGATLTLELVHWRQWNTLMPGENVGVVAYAGHRIGLRVRQALYPARTIPASARSGTGCSRRSLPDSGSRCSARPRSA